MHIRLFIRIYSNKISGYLYPDIFEYDFAQPYLIVNLTSQNQTPKNRDSNNNFQFRKKFARAARCEYE